MMAMVGCQEQMMPMGGDPGGADWEGGRFHHATQNGMQFKTDELFTSGIFHLIFYDLE